MKKVWTIDKFPHLVFGNRLRLCTYFGISYHSGYTKNREKITFKIGLTKKIHEELLEDIKEKYELGTFINITAEKVKIIKSERPKIEEKLPKKTQI